jgi:hypothetical protein
MDHPGRKRLSFTLGLGIVGAGAGVALAFALRHAGGS